MALEQVQNLPQQYVTDLGVDYGKQLAGLTSIPLDTARLAPQVACLLYTSPSPRDRQKSRMPSSA